MACYCSLPITNLLYAKLWHAWGPWDEREALGTNERPLARTRGPSHDRVSLGHYPSNIICYLLWYDMIRYDVMWGRDCKHCKAHASTISAFQLICDLIILGRFHKVVGRTFGRLRCKSSVNDIMKHMMQFSWKKLRKNVFCAKYYREVVRALLMRELLPCSSLNTYKNRWILNYYNVVL